MKVFFSRMGRISARTDEESCLDELFEYREEIEKNETKSRANKVCLEDCKLRVGEFTQTLLHIKHD